jgi:hypothetical protein
MKDRIYLIVKLVVQTKHINIKDAIRELETATVFDVQSTPNVQVLECGILKTQSLHDKKLK